MRWQRAERGSGGRAATGKPATGRRHAPGAKPRPRNRRPRGGPGGRGRRVAACTRCTELVRTRTQNRLRRGQSARAAGLSRRSPRGRRRSPGRAVRRPRRAIAQRHHRQGHEDAAPGTSTSSTSCRCRPPENRTPLPIEAASCREYLDAQLAIIQPEFICCLGACAAQNLLQTDTPIGRLRGRLHDFHGIQVLCTYHPAYLLRNPAAKRQVWDNVKILMAAMGTAAK